MVFSWRSAVGLTVNLIAASFPYRHSYPSSVNSVRWTCSSVQHGYFNLPVPPRDQHPCPKKKKGVIMMAHFNQAFTIKDWFIDIDISWCVIWTELDVVGFYRTIGRYADSSLIAIIITILCKGILWWNGNSDVKTSRFVWHIQCSAYETNATCSSEAVHG
jgi:hypothetical protein